MLKEQKTAQIHEFLLKSNVFAVALLDFEGSIIQVNDVFKDYFSEITNDLLGLPFALTVHQDDLHKFKEVIIKCIDNPHKNIEVQLRKHNLSKQADNWMQWEFSILNANSDHAAGILSVAHLIRSPPRHDDHNLYNAKSNNLKYFLDKLPIGVCELLVRSDDSYELLSFNQTFLQLWEINQDDINKHNAPWNKLDQNDFNYIKLSLIQPEEHKNPCKYQFSIKTKQGILKWLRGYAVNHHNINGLNYWYLFFIQEDDWRSNDLRLDNIYCLYQKVEQNARISAWQYDLETSKTTCTSGIYDLFESKTTLQEGYRIQENLNWLDDQISLQNLYQKILITGQPIEEQIQVTTTKQHPLWINVKASPVFNQGRIVQIIGTVQDITEKIEQEEYLKSTEYTLQAIFDSSSEHFFLIDKDFKILFFNRIVEKTAQKAFNRKMQVGDDFLDYVNEELRIAVKNAIYKAFEGEITHSEREICVGNLKIWVDLNFFPVYDDQQKIIGVAHSLVDITQRKKAEHLLAKTYQIYLSLLDSVNGIVWEAEADDLQFTFVSKKAELILGYKVREWLRPEFYPTMIHADDREFVLEYCTTQTKLCKNHDFEYRMIHKNGNTVWIRDIVTVVSIDGVPEKLRGIMIDITKQKMIEEALSDSEGRFRHMIEVSPLPKLLMDDQNNCIFISPAFTDTFGYVMEDIPSLNALLELAFPDKNYREYIRTLFQERVKQSSYELTNHEPIELNLRCKDGSDSIVLSNLVWLDEASSKMCLMTFYDITALKQYEQRILNQNTVLRDIAWAQSHQVRKPLASILGLINLLERAPYDEITSYLNYLRQSADELDAIICDIVKKSEMLDELESKD